MNVFYRSKGGLVVPITTQRVNEEEEDSCDWVGLNGSCDRIPEDALRWQDDTEYLTSNADLDEFGLRPSLDWVRDVDWLRSQEHARAWLPRFNPTEVGNRWYYNLWAKVPGEQLQGQRWRIKEASALTMRGDVIDFNDMLEAVGEHPKYDTYTWCPPQFDIECLSDPYESEADVQRVAANARRSILDIWGLLAWWTASVASWRDGMPESTCRNIEALNLAATPKRGVLLSPSRDWKEMNLPLLIRNDIPVYFMWGDAEKADPRFSRLNPDTLSEYHRELELCEVLSLFGDEIPQLAEEFSTCLRYTPYLEVRKSAYDRPATRAPRASDHTGILIYEVKDFETWGRRKLASDEDWETFDKLYHHVVVESRSRRTTTVVFLRFFKKPRAEVLESSGEFMDVDVPEQDLDEVRERFKGRCAPQLGQIFDPLTGVERQKPFDPDDPSSIEKFDRELAIVPREDGLGGREVRGRRSRFEPDIDASAFGRSIGPRYTSPNSDHSSERRAEDSSQPMAYKDGWVASMSRPDNVGNYVDRRNARMPRSGYRGRRRNPASAYTDARSNTTTPSSSSRGRSASPPPRGNIIFPARRVSPIPFSAVARRGRESMEELDARRASWLNDTRDWGANLTYELCLWRIPCDFTWSPKFLSDAYVLLSDASEVRLRYLTLITPGIRFPRHILEVAIEHGIPFRVGFKSAALELYRPQSNSLSRILTKARIETAERPLAGTGSAVYILGQWLALLGVIFEKPNAIGVIPRGGGAQWIARAFNYGGLIQSFMNGPSVALSVFHHGGNDSGDDDYLNVHWDDLADADYQNIFGYVPGLTSDRDAWMFPPDDVMELYLKAYYREWNKTCDDVFRRIKAEWCDNPCRGRLRTKKEWKDYFHTVNHGKLAPAQVINEAVIEEGRVRFARAFGGTWNKKRLADIEVPEQFRVAF
ncbi:hypothetical protein C8R47DRAFT_1246875 [Mycena vitilis]|nr:hypothetical protein C8R47DRAFT_1246875 [Mycena vitilis]